MKMRQETRKSEFEKRVYRLALEVIKFVDILPKSQSVRVISVQLLRSATSVGANFVEAHASSSRKDYINFFTHSLKSANETKFWLGLLKDSGKANRNSVDVLLQEVTEVANILGSSIITLKKSNVRDNK